VSTSILPACGDTRRHGCGRFAVARSPPALFSGFGLPLVLSELTCCVLYAALLSKLSLDKKNAGGRIRCVMITAIGSSLDLPVPVERSLFRDLFSCALEVAPRAILPAPGETKAEDGAGEVQLEVPSSKSVSNRALLLAALADGEQIPSRCQLARSHVSMAGTTLLQSLLYADDTYVMVAALRQLGMRLEFQGAGLRVYGQLPTAKLPDATSMLTQSVCLLLSFSRPSSDTSPIHLADAGTASRFLLAFCTLLKGRKTILTGSQRLKVSRSGLSLTRAASSCFIST
jgi:hypothetical protein